MFWLRNIELKQWNKDPENRERMRKWRFQNYTENDERKSCAGAFMRAAKKLEVIDEGCGFTPRLLRIAV
jgi:hypothetical protein